MGFKDKKPETHEWASYRYPVKDGERIPPIYDKEEMDEYLAIVEAMAEKWEDLEAFKKSGDAVSLVGEVRDSRNIIKHIEKEIHDSCRPCPKLVAECEQCNLGMIKSILEAS